MSGTVICTTPSPPKEKKTLSRELLPLKVVHLELRYQEVPWGLPSCLNVSSVHESSQAFVVVVLFLKLSGGLMCLLFSHALNCTYMLHKHYAI